MSITEAISADSDHLIKNDHHGFPILHKFFPSPKFISSIPLKAQKGFRDIAINFTCLDVFDEYFAIGTNVGIVYLYNRKEEHLWKLRTKEHMNPITCVKLLVSLECLVAVGTKNGRVFAFKIPFQSSEEIEKFKVEGLHTTSVTALEWARNGIKFFSGDLNGMIVCTEIDHLEHESRSSVVLEEGSTITQLSYANLFLLVSTYQRSVLYNTQKNESYQIGQKERKCPGAFGATIYDAGSESPYIYACRPGQRIWKSDYEGVIGETIVLKSDFSKSPQTLVKAVGGSNSCKDFQFGTLLLYNNNFLLTWSSKKVVLIDPKKKAIQCVWDSSNIMDVATTHQEIIILQGVRHIVRFALHPEEEERYIQKVVVCSDNAFHSLETPHAPEKEVQKENHVEVPKVMDWIKRKFSEVSLPVQEKAESLLKDGRSNTFAGVSMVKDGQSNTSAAISLPDVIEFDANIPQVEVNGNVVFEQFGSTKLTIESFLDDNIVYKPKKKKKKKKDKVKENKEDEETKQLDGVQEEAACVNDCSRNETLAESDVGSISIESSLGYSEKEAVESIESMKLSEDVPDCSTPNIPNNSMLLHNIKEADCQNVDELCESANLECINENEISDEEPDDIYSSYSSFKKKVVNNDTEKSRIEEPQQKSEEDSALKNKGYDQPKYGVECVQYTAPGPLISLSASDYHLFCIDNNNHVYISGFSDFGFKWVKLNQSGEQIAVSPSEHIVWILYRQTVYAAKSTSSLEWWKPKSVKWVPIANSISYISVDDTCAWYVSSFGQLCTNQHLSSSRPYSYPEQVLCPNNIVKTACKDGIVWVLTADDQLYCKAEGDDCVKDVEWELVTLPQTLAVSMVAFGSKKEAYMLSSNGTLWFRLGVTSLTPHGVKSTMEVESSHYIYESCGQIRKAVSKVMNSELLTNIISRQRQGIIAASSAGVWWCKKLDTILYSYEKCIIGHSWDPVVPSGTSASMQWVMVSAEGYCRSQGILWGADITGELICFSMKSVRSIAVNLPISVSLNHLQATPYSMWILSTEGDIFIRREISDRCPQGVWWQQLDTTQIDGVMFCHMSCSPEAVWACDTNGNVHVRIGTLNPPSSGHLSQVWIQLEDESSAPAFLAKKVYVGPKSYMVWAIDNQGSVYVRNKITLEFPLGNQWIFVPSPQAKQLCMSKDAVWLLKRSGKIFRRFGITKSNPTGDYWKQIPGNLSFISVTEDDDLWGVQASSLLTHNSCTLEYESRFKSTVNLEEISEDDWEDISVNVSDKDF